MAYQAIYRKWRPLVFEDIVGQSHITDTLKNQILSGRIAHAYLFCGTRGTGKTTAAKILARAVNCTNNTTGSPCNECPTCKGILDGSILDVSEIDAASNNGVENIREIREEVVYAASQTKYRVYIIDEVHMLSTGAFNALLKTLEEPPEHVIFILATTEAHKVPQTILSRCQRFDFKRIKPSDIILRMKEIAMGDNLSITEDAYALLARLADGSMRDGLSILERCVSARGASLTAEDINHVLGIAPQTLVFELVDATLSGDTEKIITILNQALSDGRDIHHFMNHVLKHFRDLMVCKVSSTPEALLDYSPEDMTLLRHQAEKTTFEKISNATSLLSEAQADAKWVKAPRIIYELALIKLCRPEFDSSKEALLDRIGTLEEKIKQGITVAASQKKDEPPKEKPKEKPKKKVSHRVFVPIDQSQLTADHPIVLAAKKWDKIAQSIVRASPHLMGPLSNRKVTIDGEGLILLFEKNEGMSKSITEQYLKSVEQALSKASGADLRVKTAFRSEIEDMMIDFWSITESSKPNSPPPDCETLDPIDTLAQRFPEIVEFTDDSEFINYDSESEHYAQSSIDETGETDEEEEFLEEDEKE
jgi:DNA polymerase-3 subunit gamma/tau